MSPPRFVALVLVATTLAASGCGGSSGSSGSLTRSELIARGDLICRRINTRLTGTTIGRQGSFAQLMPSLAAYEHAAVAEMRKLTPPASMADGWRQIVKGAQTLADATAKVGSYARGNPNISQASPPLRAAFTAAGEGTQHMVAAARREGFQDCARTP